MRPTTQERFRGAMVGVLCGDAIAAPLENKTAVVIQGELAPYGGELDFRDYIEPWKGKRFIKAGQPTDDSELSAALGLGLAAVPEFDASNIYERLRDFIHGTTPEGRRSVLTQGKAYGSGGTLRAALRPETYEDSRAAFGRGEIPIVPTNGSLMRAAAVSLRYHRDVASLVTYARWQSCITHMHPTAQAACIAYTLLVSLVLDGLDVPTAWSLTQQVLSLSPYKDIPELSAVLDIDTSQPDDSVIWPYTGSVTVSLRVALWAALSAKDFRDGITKATLVGGDTDTYAAIAGGILGARFGVEGIPSAWVAVLQGREIMFEIADRLYDLSSNV